MIHETRKYLYRYIVTEQATIRTYNAAHIHAREKTNDFSPHIMKKYNHKFVLDAPIESVRDFHCHSSSMGAITPPPIIVRIHEAPEVLEDGDQMDFTMWMGPLPIRWVAEIEKHQPDSFIDRQLRGPFTLWEHRHTFIAVDENRTEVHDEVSAILSTNWFWRALGFGMWLNMPVLFAFRAWKTKRILAGKRTQLGSQSSTYA